MLRSTFVHLNCVENLDSSTLNDPWFEAIQLRVMRQIKKTSSNELFRCLERFRFRALILPDRKERLPAGGESGYLPRFMHRSMIGEHKLR